MPAGRRFEFVGTLSSTFARYCARYTLEGGAVSWLCVPVRRKRISPLVTMTKGKRDLPLSVLD